VDPSGSNQNTHQFPLRDMTLQVMIQAVMSWVAMDKALLEPVGLSLCADLFLVRSLWTDCPHPSEECLVRAEAPPVFESEAFIREL
jgi:hypothetical protein